MLEPDERKLSSPVLRGPAPSNGGWPLGNSSMKRSGLPNQLLDVLLHTIARSELARVRTELS
jgi:hypothetical protein